MGFDDEATRALWQGMLESLTQALLDVRSEALEQVLPRPSFVSVLPRGVLEQTHFCRFGCWFVSTLL